MINMVHVFTLDIFKYQHLTAYKILNATDIYAGPE